MQQGILPIACLRETTTAQLLLQVEPLQRAVPFQETTRAVLRVVATRTRERHTVEIRAERLRAMQEVCDGLAALRSESLRAVSANQNALVFQLLPQWRR